MAWSIRRGAAGELRTGNSVIREPAAGSGFEPLVAAHSRALDAISREIADALRGMSR